MPPVIAGFLYAGQSLEALEQAGMLQLEGDRALARKLATLFPLPDKVGASG